MLLSLDNWIAKRVAQNQDRETIRIDYRVEHLYSYNATLQVPFEIIGPTPEGIRLNAYVTGGDAHGPKINGKLRFAGGDWLIVRPDGVAILDVRTTLATHDGALIYVTHKGIWDLGREGYAKVLRGDSLPSGLHIRTTPVFHTSHPAYQWLHRLHRLMVGQVFPDEAHVRCDVYAIR